MPEPGLAPFSIEYLLRYHGLIERLDPPVKSAQIRHLHRAAVNAPGKIPSITTERGLAGDSVHPVVEFQPGLFLLASVQSQGNLRGAWHEHRPSGFCRNRPRHFAN